MASGATAVIRQAVRQRLGMLQELTGLPAVFGGAVEDSDGQPSVVVSQFSGLRTPALDGLVVPVGTGLGGKAAGLGRAVVVEDYAGSRMISHEYDRAVQHEGLVSLLAAPVRHGDAVVAVLYAASRTGAISERSVRAAETVARYVERDLEHMLPPAAAKSDAVSPGVVAELRAVAEELGANPLRPRLENALDALTRNGHEQREPDGPNPLTTRQAQILRLVEDGLTNREIAQRTGLADATVKTYVHDAMRRLDAHTRTRAVYLARSRGLL